MGPRPLVGLPMIPLYHEPHFTFRFGEDRIIPRFHLDGVEAGRRVSVFRCDPDTGEQLSFLVTGMVGNGGWTDLMKPIRVKAGDAFIAVVEAAPGTKQNYWREAISAELAVTSCNRPFSAKGIIASRTSAASSSAFNPIRERETVDIEYVRCTRASMESVRLSNTAICSRFGTRIRAGCLHG